MIRIFVGCGVDGKDAENQLALEWSIRSRTTSEVSIEWLKLSRDPASPWYSNHKKGEGWLTNGWVTEFSALRWSLPSVCNWEGRSIYCDSDIIFLSPIDDLFNLSLAPGKVAAAKSDRRFCVTLFDNAACRKHVGDWKTLMRGGGNTLKGKGHLVQEFTAEQSWNCLDGEQLPIADIRGLHFTSIDSNPAVPLAMARLKGKHWFDGQPKLHWRPELTELWNREYNAALAAGYKIENYIPSEVFGPVPKRSLQNYKGLHAR